MEMEKETKTYRFEKEVIKHSEQNPLIPSFAEWACDSYKKEFMEISTLVEKMSKYSRMANACKDRIKHLKEEQKKGNYLGMVEPHVMEWIENEAIKRIKISTFEGVYKSFVNRFGIENINRKQFKLLVNRIEQEKRLNSGKK